MTTDEASSSRLLLDIRRLMDEAFEGTFTQEDWDHTIGGRHFVVEEAGVLVAHASVIPRPIEIDRRAFRTGYVEGVATVPARQRRGIGSFAMQAVSDYVRATFELGALATERHAFYEALGWERWRGPSFVRRGSQLVRTQEDDDALMVLRFGPSTGIDLDASISCDFRTGDVW